MTGEVGTLLVGLGLLSALYTAGATLVGLHREDERWLASGRNAVVATSVLLGGALLALLVAFLTGNFSLAYVADHGSRALPLYLKVSALWAGQEGSLLLWSWMQALFAVLTLHLSGRKALPLLPWVTVFLALITAFFTGVTLLTSNPFVLRTPVPPDGLGLNPLLRHPGMILHPPALYVGYVGLAVPFAFALAALVRGRLAAWTRAARGWILVAWLGLSLGLLLGMRWAYDVLGWGGYWGWDPVENAGLMPWFTATALLHGLVMQGERRGFRLWNLLLAIFSFALVLFGTFATRSGVIQSVHAYARSDVGTYYAGAIVVTLLLSAALLVWRRGHLQADGEGEGLLSREGLFFLTFLLFVTLTVSVFVGSTLPTLTELFGGQRFEAGPAWFDRVTGPQFALLVLLLGICPLLGRSAALLRARRGWRWSIPAGALLAVVLAIFAGFTRPLSLIGFGIVGLAGTTALVEIGAGVAARARRTEDAPLNALWHLLRTQRRRYGGYLVHLGVVLMALGVIGTRLYALEEDVVLTSGVGRLVGGYTFVYQELRQETAPDRTTLWAEVDVREAGDYRATLTPRLIRYTGYRESVAVPAVRTGLREDLYLVLSSWDEGGRTVTLSVTVNPLINFLWLGGLLLIAGGAFALWPRTTRWEGLVAGVLLLLLIGAGWAMWGAPHGNLRRVNPRPTVGEPAPDFRLRLLDGTTFSLAEQRGEVVVVNLWTSWCEPCREELPDLQALWEVYGERGVRFVGVAHQDEPEGVRDAVADYGLTYPVGLDEGQRIADAYGITGVPETFVVAPDGRVAYVHVGPVTAEVLAAELDALLEEAP